MRYSIRTKFLVLISALLLVIFSGTTYFLIRTNTASLRQRLYNESRAFATLATQPIGNVFAIYKDSGTSKITEEVNHFSELNPSVVNIRIVDITGKELYVHSEELSQLITPAEAATFKPLYKSENQGALSQVIYPYFEASGVHRFSIAYDISDHTIEEAIRQEVNSMLTFGILSLLLTLTSAYILINLFIIRPVRQVSAQAAVISAGNLNQQITLHTKDEIGQLSDAVNSMADSLKRSIEELREIDQVKSEFMMITSHNLRTPLTIISGYLENFELFKDPEKSKNALERIGASVKRLETFAEDILTISKFELGEASLQTEEVVIHDFIKRIADEFAPTAALKEQTFKTELSQGEARVNISKPHIRSAVWNILDNATKFTPQGGTITLRLLQNDNQVQISVSDTGSGITKEEQEKLFTKFHRGTSTLTYDYEGTGIGLYSSKMILEKHGGDIVAVSEEGKGSTFTIILPTAHSTAKPEPTVEPSVH